MACPAVPWRRLERSGNAASQIDGRLRQNPAYRLTHFTMGSVRAILALLFSLNFTKIGTNSY